MSILTDLFPDLTDIQDELNDDIISFQQQQQLYDYKFEIDEVHFKNFSDDVYTQDNTFSNNYATGSSTGIDPVALEDDIKSSLRYVSLPNLEIGLVTPPLSFMEESTEPNTPISLAKDNTVIAETLASQTTPQLTLATSPAESSASPGPRRGSDEDGQGKRIGDSRLSLPELAKILNLQDNHKETARREREILKILKEELGFQLGQKTWIRDTPLQERNMLIDRLHYIVQERFQYGYTREILETIVRRASYYMMQGRLRRERRAERKRQNTQSVL